MAMESAHEIDSLGRRGWGADDGTMSDPTLPPEPSREFPPIEPGPLSEPPAVPGFGPRPMPRTSPDTGTPRSRVLALIVVGILYLVIAGSQNLTAIFAEKPDPIGRKPAGGEAAKLLLLLDDALSRGGLVTENTLGNTAASQFATTDLHPADRLQAVLVLGETDSPQAALDWLAAVESGQDLDSLRKKLVAGLAWQKDVDRTDSGSEWAAWKGKDGPEIDTEALADAEAMEVLYSLGPDALTTDQRTRLRDRYGWLGKLALAPDDPNAPERRALFADAPWAIALIVLVLMVLTIGGLGGLTMFIIAAIFFLSRRMPRRFEPPMPGGSVFLETFGVFLAGFGLLHFGSGVVAMLFAAPPTGGTVATAESTAAMDAVLRWILLGTLLVQWLLLLTIFWPRLRGVGGLEWRNAVGWHAPRGIWREVLAGIAGYFAGLPLLFGAMMLTLLLNVISSWVLGKPAEPPSNPMLDMVANGDVLVIVLFLSLATIWAPIVEETLFRGSLYRHFRARHGAFVCAIATALIFAFMHSYGPLMVSPIIALGFIFAMIREWRGSLIGPITAHFLHNSTIMVLMIVGVQAMK